MKLHKLKTVLAGMILVTSISSLKAASIAEVNALLTVESDGRHHKVGDSGRALGGWQFWEVAWTQTTQYRASLKLPVYPYEHAKNKQSSYLYAISWLDWNTQQFIAKRGRKPTRQELYACHNLGISGFQQRGWDLKKCPAVTRRAAAKFAKLAQF